MLCFTLYEYRKADFIGLIHENTYSDYDTGKYLGLHGLNFIVRHPQSHQE